MIPLHTASTRHVMSCSMSVSSPFALRRCHLHPAQRNTPLTLNRSPFRRLDDDVRACHPRPRLHLRRHRPLLRHRHLLLRHRHRQRHRRSFQLHQHRHQPRRRKLPRGLSHLRPRVHLLQQRRCQRLHLLHLLESSLHRCHTRWSHVARLGYPSPIRGMPISRTLTTCCARFALLFVTLPGAPQCKMSSTPFKPMAPGSWCLNLAVPTSSPASGYSETSSMPTARWNAEKHVGSSVGSHSDPAWTSTRPSLLWLNRRQYGLYFILLLLVTGPFTSSTSRTPSSMAI